jgi:hypothetical protein
MVRGARLSRLSPGLLGLRPAVKRPPYLRGISRLEADVPEAVGYSITSISTSRTVVIEVVTAGIAEITVSEFVEVHRVMNPLSNDIPQHIAGEHHGQSI